MSHDTYSTRWRVLALLGFAELLGMSLWFSASAVTPQLRSIWGLTVAGGGGLITSWHLGLVCGAAIAVALNLAVVIPAGGFLSACSLWGAPFNGAFRGALVFPPPLVWGFLRAFFLPGVSPPA